jgi:hypothetical protein
LIQQLEFWGNFGAGMERVGYRDVEDSMLSRALSLAAASLFGCLVATAGWAQNLDAGKSPAQIFSGNCTTCHKSSRGLLKTVSPSSLPGFLREHYTTGSEMAQMLSGFLLASGGGAAAAPARGRLEAGSNLRADAPIGGATPESNQGAESPGRRGRMPAVAARPDVDGLETPAGRRSRQAKPDRLEATQPPTEANTPGDQSGEKAGAKSKLAKKNRRGVPPSSEPPAEPAAVPAPELAARPEPKAEPKPEASPEPVSPPAVSAKAIDAAVPVPEPVNLPPPTAADIKLDGASEGMKAEAPKATPHPTVSAAAPSGPPAPPISQ